MATVAMDTASWTVCEGQATWVPDGLGRRWEEKVSKPCGHSTLAQISEQGMLVCTFTNESQCFSADFEFKENDSLGHSRA